MKKWYNITENKVQSGGKKRKYADVFVLDEIGGFGVSARAFIQDIAALDVEVINLQIDSPGGSITDGIAIYNALRAHKAQVDVYINGMAGSIASVVILAGDNVYIPENAFVFTHLPMLSQLQMPNRKDLQEGIESLEKFETVLANIYMKHTGAGEEQVQQWMENDTYFFGQDAVDAGFATEVVDKVEMVAQYDPKQYAFYKSLPQNGVDEEVTNKTEVTMDEQIQEEAVEETEVVAQAEEVEAAVEESSEALEPEATAAVSDDIVVECEACEDNEEVDEEIEDLEAIIAYEESRKAGILEVSEKYNANGVLNKAVIAALAGNTSVEQFKDIVLETLAKAPTSAKLEKAVTTNKDTDADALRAKLAETTNPVEKGVLARQLREIR